MLRYNFFKKEVVTAYLRELRKNQPFPVKGTRLFRNAVSSNASVFTETHTTWTTELG